MRQPAKVGDRAWDICGSALECRRIGREQIGMPTQLRAKSAERTQKLRIEPDAGDMKIKKLPLHQANELTCREMPPRAGQIKAYCPGTTAISRHLGLIRKYNPRG